MVRCHCHCHWIVRKGWSCVGTSDEKTMQVNTSKCPSIQPDAYLRRGWRGSYIIIACCFTVELRTQGMLDSKPIRTPLFCMLLSRYPSMQQHRKFPTDTVSLHCIYIYKSTWIVNAETTRGLSSRSYQHVATSINFGLDHHQLDLCCPRRLSSVGDEPAMLTDKAVQCRRLHWDSRRLSYSSIDKWW